MWDGNYLGELKLVGIWFKDDTKQPALWYLTVITAAQLFIDGAHQQETGAKNLDRL
jgi:hypothetical protein